MHSDKIAEIFTLNKDLIHKISIKKMTKLALRPLDMSLSNEKYTKELNDSFYNLNKSLEYLKSLETDKITKEILCL